MPVEQRTPAEYLAALERNGGSRVKAAAELKVGVRMMYKMLAILRQRGETIPKSPYVDPGQMTEVLDPLHNIAPEGFKTKGVSSYHGPEGELRGYWLKTNEDYDQTMMLLEAATRALSESIPAQEPIAPPQTPLIGSLCNLYTITDYHVGMLAWRREGGDDWDLNIAEHTLIAAFRDLIQRSPAAAVGILAQLGDFLHFDGLEAVTPTSAHNLDTDSRFQKIVEVAVRVLRAVINMLLAKHGRVHVIMAEGNHDIASSVWLRVLFGEVYKNDPRVTVEMTPLPYYAYQHGKTMLAFHHGHLTKKEKISSKIPAQFPKMWGETEFRYCHMGHLHHEWVREDDGIKVTQHQTLASRDAHAARNAWYASRAAKCITYHDEFGELGSVTVTPEMLAA